MIFSSDLPSSSSAWRDTEDQMITTIPESSLWYSRFTEENKPLLALVYSLRRVSMCILLLFKKSHCGRHVLLLSRSTKPPFRLPAGIFFLVRKTFLMFHFVLISDFAYYCTSQLKIYGTMPCKSFSEGQLSKATVNLADQWRTFNFHHFWTDQIEARMEENALVNGNAHMSHGADALGMDRS